MLFYNCGGGGGGGVWIGRRGESKELTPKKIFTNEVWKPQLHWENVSPVKSIPN